MKRALFLDRDGIINEVVTRNGTHHSPKNWDEIKFYPDMDPVSSLKELGLKLILMTNQPDLERKIIAEDFIEELHEKIKLKYGLDAVYCCPFSSNDHPLKKPNPGMFLQASKDFDLKLADCFHLGDTERDTGAAKNCGCKSILWDRPYNKGIPSDYRVHNFEELRLLLSTALT